jgi:hypothetical protein
MNILYYYYYYDVLVHLATADALIAYSRVKFHPIIHPTNSPNVTYAKLYADPETNHFYRSSRFIMNYTWNSGGKLGITKAR